MKDSNRISKKRWLCVFLLFAAVHIALFLMLINGGFPTDEIRSGITLLIMAISVTLWVQNLWMVAILYKSSGSDILKKIGSCQDLMWIVAAVLSSAIPYILTTDYPGPVFFAALMVDSLFCSFAGRILGGIDPFRNWSPDPVIRRTELRLAISFAFFFASILIKIFTKIDPLYIPLNPVGLCLIILNVIDLNRLLKQDCSQERKDDLESRWIFQILALILFVINSLVWCLDVVIFLQESALRS